MKYFPILFVLMSVAVHGQDHSANAPVCFEPFSKTFAEVAVSSKDEVANISREFRNAVLEADGETTGYVYVFGGRTSRVSEIDELIKLVQTEIGLESGHNSRVSVQGGGYREVATIVFTVKPLKCSNYSIPLPDFMADKVDFLEFPPENTLRLSRQDLYQYLEDSPLAECPPAARAVRACTDGTEVEVFVAVNSQGKPLVSQALNAHPLLRAAAAASVKRWKFSPPTIDGKRYNLAGMVLVRFKEGPEITTNE